MNMGPPSVSFRWICLLSVWLVFDSTQAFGQRPFDVESLCLPNQYSCGTRCFPFAKLCDDEVDCEDGSDESNCHPEVTCEPGEFKCATDGKCIPIISLCNGYRDCSDGADERLTACERDGPVATGTCKPGEFKCAVDGKCIPITSVCNGQSDCNDGADERQAACKNDGQVPVLVAATCRPGEFKCTIDGKCIPIINVCNGYSDCDDGADERQAACRHDVVPDCRAGEFKCVLDGKCIPLSNVCDGHGDCGDAADERHAACGR